MPTRPPTRTATGPRAGTPRTPAIELPPQPPLRVEPLSPPQVAPLLSQAVTEEGTAFTNRLGLLEAWRGLRDADLIAASGIDGCKFCHASGFIGGNATYEGALAMALKTIADSA